MLLNRKAEACCDDHVFSQILDHFKDEVFFFGELITYALMFQYAKYSRS